MDIDGGYDLGIEFTRTSQHDDVNTMVSIGSHATMVMLSGNGGEVSGLMRLNDRDPFDPRNPIVTKPGSLENGHRYRLNIRARMLRNQRASIDVALDGKLYLPHWEGDPSELSYHPGWTMPNPKRLGLGAYGGIVTFHSVQLRMVSGQASLDPAVAESLSPRIAPAVVGSDKLTGPLNVSSNNWVDILGRADTTRDVVKGNWSRKGKQLNCEAGELSRIALPVTMNGSYDFEVEFTRTSGDGDVGAVLSVASNPCLITLSSYKGAVSGIANVDGRDASSVDNPTIVRPGPIENGQRHKLLASVRILSSDRASIDVSLDGKPYLPHWEGNPAALSLSPIWSMPNPKQLGLAAYQSDVTFHSARLRTAAPLPAPATAATGKPIGGGKVPLGKAIDLLASVDVKRDATKGQWTPQGGTIVSDDQVSTVTFPLEITKSSYELRVEFSRDRGEGCFVMSFPVGARTASFTLCTKGRDGEYSGLEMIAGERADHRANPTGRSPSTLENGRRYTARVLVKVQHENAEINCFLDNDQLVTWNGGVDLLSQYNEWKIAPHRAGASEWHSPSTIYSASFRELK